MKRLMRQAIFVSSVALAAATALPAFAADPIKIGLLGTTSGPYAI